MIVSNIVTDKLINYLNNVNPFIEIYCGIYKLSFKKHSDKALIFDHIDMISKYYFIFDTEQFSSLYMYNEQLNKNVAKYKCMGLDISISFDLNLSDNIESVLDKLTLKNIYLATPSMIKYNTFECSIVDVNIAEIKLSVCKDEMTREVLLGFFRNEKNHYMMNYFTDYSIILDKNNVIVDGKYKILALKFLYNSQNIRCVKLNELSLPVNKEELTIPTPDKDIIKFIHDKYKVDPLDDMVSNTIHEEYVKHVKEWHNSL